jgi:hypothetical protein
MWRLLTLGEVGSSLAACLRGAWPASCGWPVDVTHVLGLPFLKKDLSVDVFFSPGSWIC